MSTLLQYHTVRAVAAFPPPEPGEMVTDVPFLHALGVVLRAPPALLCAANACHSYARVVAPRFFVLADPDHDPTGLPGCWLRYDAAGVSAEVERAVFDVRPVRVHWSVRSIPCVV